MDVAKLDFREANEDFLPNFVLVAISGLLAVGLYISYVFAVRFRLTFLHGYFLSPGPLIDDRYGFYWSLTTIDCFRIVVFLLYLFILKNLISTWRKNLYRAVVVFWLIFDVVLLISLWITSLTCNNSLTPSNPCNSPQYCSVYGASYPERCGPGPYTGSVDALQPNPVFFAWFWFVVAFSLFDLFMLYQSESLRTAVRRYIFSNNLLRNIN